MTAGSYSLSSVWKVEGGGKLLGSPASDSGWTSIYTPPAGLRRELLAVFREACRTVAYAHSRGVIHRDLKPSNVMIGSFGEVQIVDWGFAKVLCRGGVHDERLRKQAERNRTLISTVRSREASDSSIAGSVMGTPAYMPPEQATGEMDLLGPASDVFALGVILYEILTGGRPFRGDILRMVRAVTTGAIPPIEPRQGSLVDDALVAITEDEVSSRGDHHEQQNDHDGLVLYERIHSQQSSRSEQCGQFRSSSPDA